MMNVRSIGFFGLFLSFFGPFQGCKSTSGGFASQVASLKPSEGSIFYDSSDHRCHLNGTHQPGLKDKKAREELMKEVVKVAEMTPANRDIIIRKIDATCMDFTDFNFSQALGDFHYPILQEWDFRGAKFQNTDLSFLILDDANLRGAQLDSLIIGYTQISGQIDDHTLISPSLKSFIIGDRFVVSQ